MKTILIAGSTGTIGSYLMSYLTQKGYVVWGISRGPSAGRTLRLDVAHADEKDISALLNGKNIDVIIHCIASLKPRSPEDILLASTASNRLLLNGVGRKKRHIIFGSAAEYGLQDVAALDESTRLLPDTDYGLSKALQTENALTCFKSYGIKGAILRLSNVISPSASQKSLIHKLLAQIKNPEGKEVSINDYSIMRDFIDIRDVAALVEKFLQKDIYGSVYNISSGQNTTYRQLINEANAVLKESDLPGLRIVEGDKTEQFNTAPIPNEKISGLLGHYPFHTIKSTFSWCIEEVLRTK